ncbi:MAG: hypothetical protein AAF391_06960, partial [Bacteroidota bacterium]
ASKMFNVVRQKSDDEDFDLRTIANRIKQEIQQVPKLRNNYPVLDKDLLEEISLPTLEAILELVNPNLVNRKINSLISSIIASSATSNITMLQVALGLLVQEKRLIQHLYEYRITASYDEIQRFRMSAAATSTSLDQIMELLDKGNGLIQGISDNFDANICSQNGLKQTHSLATIITQANDLKDSQGRKPIPRLKKAEVSTVKLREITCQQHIGEKKPTMPQHHAEVGLLSLKILCEQKLMVVRSNEVDFTFIKESLENSKTPDYSGYNTKTAREAGQSVKPKTNILYRPLINKIPKEPSTILSAMIDVEEVSRNAGQEYSIFTCDQQLYRVTLDIIWTNPDRWKCFYPRLGGMHWLMSFVGCIGKLMENSGMEKILSAAFAGVPKMLTGKKFPMNVRALRLLVLELLRSFIGGMETYAELEIFLSNASAKSLVAEHWIKNLIKPVLLIMMYIRAEREGEFALHLYASKKMLPYFFAAGHRNYARDGLVYLRMMEKLPRDVLAKFENGEHVIRLKEGLWNGIWSDMGIECTYMKIGKGPTGMIGKTTNSRSVQTWANGHHLCSELLTELESLRNSTKTSSNETHKEEGKGRIQSDAIDKRKLQVALINCIHPLEVGDHPADKLVNIYTGEEAPSNVNVHQAVEIGEKQLAKFQDSLPEGFRETLTCEVVTMAHVQKKKKVHTKDAFNTELIFSRVLYLLGTGQLEFNNLFDYELSPVPTSLFQDTGEPRFPTAKADLKNKMKIEVSSRGISNDAVLIDGGGMLHSAIHWPKDGFVADLVKVIDHYLTKTTASTDAYLIFDRYYDYSIKSATRQKRIGKFKTAHTLSLNTILPPKEVCMSSTKTKESLIEVVSNELIQRYKSRKNQSKLVVTSKNACPVETEKGYLIERSDLESKYDEADYLIPQQVDAAIKEGKKSIKVVLSDTDVFVLLCSMHKSQGWNAEVFVQDFHSEKNYISIKKTVEKRNEIIPSIIGLHALTGCDTVPMMFGVGKAKGLNVVKKFPLELLGEENADEIQIINESKKFVADCYGMKDISSSKNRYVLMTF